MIKDWQELQRMTRGEAVIIERIRLKESGIAIEGEFELPPLACLTDEDQVFAAAFVRCHGSIKQMEEFFGISYPTVKNRLNRIAEKLDFVKIESAPARSETLDRLERGEITAEQAIKMLREQKR
nr:DUF2089 domain-containing protein [candidate division Zixibacteria bacterium]